MAIEFGAQRIANLNRANTRGGARKNEVTGFERHKLRYIRNNGVYAENKIFGVPDLPEFTVLKQLEFSFIYIDLTFLNPGIRKRRTVVKTFCFFPGQTVFLALLLNVSGGEIYAKRKMCVILVGKFRGDMLAHLFDTNNELAFEMQVFGEGGVIKISFSE